MAETRHQLYFDRIAGEFNAHYEIEKRGWSRVLDGLFRRGMFERFRYVTERLDWRGESVLDVGCGPGHYMAALVARGARDVVGLDFAPAMVALAERNLKRWGADAKCRLILCDFLETSFERDFDTVVAIGYFDYILGEAALDRHFGQMLAVSRRRVVASFPYRWSFKTLPRWLWLGRRGCPVAFYAVAEVKALMHRLAVPRFRIERMSGTVLVIAEKL